MDEKEDNQKRQYKYEKRKEETYYVLKNLRTRSRQEKEKTKVLEGGEGAPAKGNVERDTHEEGRPKAWT